MPWRNRRAPIDLDAGPSIGRFIPFSSHVDPRTVRTREGDYVRVWTIRGIAFESLAPDEIAARHETLNQLIRSLGDGDIAFWSHRVRRRVVATLPDSSDNDFAALLASQYAHSLSTSRMLANELDLTVAFRLDGTSLPALFPLRRPARLDDLIASETRALARLDEISLQVESGLARYGPRALTTYRERNQLNSEVLEFFGLLVNGRWEPTPVSDGPIYDTLPNVRLFFGSERIEIRALQRVATGAARHPDHRCHRSLAPHSRRPTHEWRAF